MLQMIFDRLHISSDWIAGFCKRWQIAELALIGSILRDDFAPDSDVDVLVTFTPDAPWSLLEIALMKEELEQAFGRPVDLIEQDAIRNPYRRAGMLRHKEVLYAA